MSANLVNLYVSQFATNIQLLLQQKGSRLRPFVMSGSHIGKQASPVDQLGAISMQAVAARYAPMGRVDAAVDRRWVFPSDFDLPQLIDSFDKLRLLSDPQSVYVENAVYAAGRQMDDLIIAAMNGTAKTGEIGGTSTALPSGQKVSRTFGAAASTGLTVAKLREAKRILLANEVDIDNDPITCAVTATQHDNLLAEAQVISTDFNDMPVLVEGKIKRFLGINFVHTERLALSTDGNSDRLCPVWAKSGMYLGLWNDISTDISQRKDLQGLPWQAYVYMTAGATRLEEKKLVQVACDE
ncbi:MAG TPA: phage capsid protein [Rhabdochlamydiaceae bacterium]|nr:phage capsid protein [Rhabdochlamydiaceae bacterium]